MTSLLQKSDTLFSLPPDRKCSISLLACSAVGSKKLAGVKMSKLVKIKKGGRIKA